jgi:hypothetical protein
MLTALIVAFLLSETVVRDASAVRVSKGYFFIRYSPIAVTSCTSSGSYCTMTGW